MMNKKPLSNDRGSASVIVIMVMLLLVVFGVLAFVSGSSSLRLAEKNAQTVKAYYLLDKRGEITVAKTLEMLESEAFGTAVAEKTAKLEGVAEAAVFSRNSGEAELILTIQEPSDKSGASLRIRLKPVTGSGGANALEIQEWKLVYKPFIYDKTVDLWEGVNE